MCEGRMKMGVPTQKDQQFTLLPSFCSDRLSVNSVVPTHVGKGHLLYTFTSSNANLSPKHPHRHTTNVLLVIWAFLSPDKLTRKMNHHKGHRDQRRYQSIYKYSLDLSFFSKILPLRPPVYTYALPGVFQMRDPCILPSPENNSPGFYKYGRGQLPG